MPDLDQALLFVEVAQRGSISAAARELQITRATAARRLTALEERIGVQLVHRTTRMLSLTSAGQAYLTHAIEARDALHRAEDAAVSTASTPTGVLRIAGPSINLDLLLTPMLIIFDQMYPDIDVEMFLDADIRNLVAEGIDLGMQIGLKHNSELTVRKLLKTEFILVASPGYLKRRGRPETLKDLSEHSCLLYRDIEGAIHGWPLVSGRIFFPARAKLTSNSYDLLINSALRGLGLAVLPRNLMQAQIDSGEFVHVLQDVIAEETWVSLVYSATRIIPPKVRAFIDFTQDFLDASNM